MTSSQFLKNVFKYVDVTLTVNSISPDWWVVSSAVLRVYSLRKTWICALDFAMSEVDSGSS